MKFLRRLLVKWRCYRCGHLWASFDPSLYSRRETVSRLARLINSHCERCGVAYMTVNGR